MIKWTLADLREANMRRQEEWCPDTLPDLAFRGLELGGEAGEALNVIKKIETRKVWVDRGPALPLTIWHKSWPTLLYVPILWLQLRALI